VSSSAADDGLSDVAGRHGATSDCRISGWLGAGQPGLRINRGQPRIAATRPAEPFPSHLFDATRVPPCDADL